MFHLFAKPQEADREDLAGEATCTEDPGVAKEYKKVDLLSNNQPINANLNGFQSKTE